MVGVQDFSSRISQDFQDFSSGFSELVGMMGEKKKADLPPFKKIRFVRRHFRLGEELSHVLQQREDGLT
jgi:hypothetical protein